MQKRDYRLTNLLGALPMIKRLHDITARSDATEFYRLDNRSSCNFELMRVSVMSEKNLRDEFNILGNWNPSDETPCRWKGVNCTSGYNAAVQSLDLRSMNLSGTLSSSIGGLVCLTVLDLSHNGLTGNIPKEMRNCSKLQSLKLHDNEFYGQIPDELYNLSHLKDLDLFNNMISGPISEEFGRLSLVSLLHTTNLTGPPSITRETKTVENI
ncbi:hypothetical protein HAX54_024692 [Datura stramonium]|uniref:Leucine-rich repeat-containing N-terminal plant-type domain-containing protein n=1 Tax=Datura stramonium TaxID=4076 RepID=A0ABS8RGK6_DATST|nr:hypothetical protein [Datura stramonium]